MKQLLLLAATLSFAAAVQASDANPDLPAEWRSFTSDEIRMHCGAHSYFTAKALAASPQYQGKHVPGALLLYYTWTDGFGASSMALAERAIEAVEAAPSDQAATQRAFCLAQGVRLHASLDAETQRQLALKAQDEAVKLLAEVAEDAAQ